MFIAKAILFAATAINPAQALDEEELGLAEATAIVEEDEIEEGEFLFDDIEFLADIEDES